MKFDIVILGLSVTSSSGNGHPATYRSRIRGLAALGHNVLFLERDQPWYAGNRDEPHPAGAVTKLYTSLEELQRQYEIPVSEAALVIVGSFVPEGIQVGEWVLSAAQGHTAFYDIDTPLTLAKLESGGAEYINADLIRRCRCYFSFTGGPLLRRIEQRFGSPMARPLYCSVDPQYYRPVRSQAVWDLAYLGTYSEDRQRLWTVSDRTRAALAARKVCCVRTRLPGRRPARATWIAKFIYRRASIQTSMGRNALDSI